MSTLKWLPCPACGSYNCECLVCTINADEKQTVHFHMSCEDCYTSGPIADDEASAKEKWNSMPRRPDYNDVDCAGCPERRLRAERDWLVEKLADISDKVNKDRALPFCAACNICPVGDDEMEGRTCAVAITEAARRAVEAGPIPQPAEPEES